MGRPSIENPEFFGQIQTRQFEHFPGLFVTPGELSELPQQIADKIPELGELAEKGRHFVVKEYLSRVKKESRSMAENVNDDRWTLAELTEKNLVIQPGKANKLSAVDFNNDRTLVDSVQVLSDRQKAVRDYFSELPEFVVPSYFFIASASVQGRKKTKDLANQQETKN